ncbi:MAG TPA: trehalase family glycosidase [Terriglobales bacterium]|jgi:alpha,alpha-trehalase|nr:trehalase family glycosidase [Terriglobales bacterium]
MMRRETAPQRGRSHRLLFLALFAICLPLISAPGYAAETKSSPQSGLAPILDYISSGWDTLTRSMTDCQTVVDPKLTVPSVLYLPADFPPTPAVQELQKRCQVDVQKLPAVISAPGQIDPGKMVPGLLYLENKYVVPGGRFNEMYGWDSYFIILGLLRAGRTGLARGMVENFFFEIEHYGTILNANRAYYLTRSQPPFLTSMIMAVYESEKAAGREDRGWLERAYGFASKDYETWNREPHLAGSTGLSRYYDFGNGPTPESLKDEAGSYRKVAGYFLLHPQAGRNYLAENAGDADSGVGLPYSVQICDAPNTMAKPECEAARKISLSPDYYKGDRAMRESGFDISFRFGPYGAATHHYAPICLNSLLYKTEKDLQAMGEILGRKDDAQKWSQRAAARKDRIQKYLWDPARRLFFDYDFETGVRSSYEYVTTYYPLWAGLATPEQAQELVRNLGIFERSGGLSMSSNYADVQWDYPYGWAPTQIIAIEGLRRYGFNDDANRISYNFLATVVENFRRDGTIREKYNVVTRSSESGVHAGYQQNVIGFGWTNAAFLLFLHDLPKDWVDRLAKEQVGRTSSSPR